MKFQEFIQVLFALRQATRFGKVTWQHHDSMGDSGERIHWYLLIFGQFDVTIKSLCATGLSICVKSRGELLAEYDTLTAYTYARPVVCLSTPMPKHDLLQYSEAFPECLQLLNPSEKLLLDLLLSALTVEISKKSKSETQLLISSLQV